MDKRKLNRITAVFLTLVVLVVARMLSGSFRRPTRVVLPQETESSGQFPGGEETANDALNVVAVAPNTVQSAIRTLERPARYRRTINTQRFWSGGSGTLETTVSVSAPWTRLDRTEADGRLRHTLTDGQTTYVWYNSETAVFSAPAGEISSDAEQAIPTYEEILELPAERIVSADYRVIGTDVSCIYVETDTDQNGYRLRYWVSVDSGLLVAAEKLLEEETVYRMWETAVDLSPAFSTEFTLPDGTVLGDE